MKIPLKVLPGIPMGLLTLAHILMIQNRKSRIFPFYLSKPATSQDHKVINPMIMTAPLLIFVSTRI